VSAATRLAMKRVDLLGPVDLGDAAAQIEQLEADANYFWWLTEGQLRALGTALLKRPPTSLQLVDLRAAVATELAGRPGGRWVASWAELAGVGGVLGAGRQLEELVDAALAGKQGVAALRRELGLEWASI